MKILDIGRSKWFCVEAEGFKGQICPSSLVQQLVIEMEQRSAGKVSEVQPTTECFVDLPGMISIDRSLQTVDVDGLKFTVPSQDFELIFKGLQNKTLRRFNDGSEYFKLQSWCNCCLFTPKQREHILDWMTKRMPTVKKIALKEDEEFVIQIDKINKEKQRVVSGRAELIRQQMAGKKPREDA